jgi:hypothetical protein
MGCSTTVRMQRPFTSEAVDEANSMLAGRNATVTYTPRGGEPQKDVASAIALTPEKVRWTVWETEFARDRRNLPGQPVEAPIDAVRKITMCDAACHGRGALEGAGFGLAAGLLAGFIAANACSGEYCRYWLISGPVLGIPLGALIGAGSGHRTIIELDPPTSGR